MVPGIGRILFAEDSTVRLMWRQLLPITILSLRFTLLRDIRSTIRLDNGYLIQLNNGNYPWNPSANGSFNTYGKWCTVSIDLQTVSGNAFSEGWTGLSFILQPNSDWNVDHSFANIRIEKKIR